MTEASKEHLTTVLDGLQKYEHCHLECDGLTRILSYVLKTENIEHKVMVGEISDPQPNNLKGHERWSLYTFSMSNLRSREGTQQNSTD
jgi:hypothetical protein